MIEVDIYGNWKGTAGPEHVTTFMSDSRSKGLDKALDYMLEHIKLHVRFALEEIYLDIIDQFPASKSLIPCHENDHFKKVLLDGGEWLLHYCPADLSRALPKGIWKYIDNISNFHTKEVVPGVYYTVKLTRKEQ